MVRKKVSYSNQPDCWDKDGVAQSFSDTDMMKNPVCTCHHEKSWCDLHMSTKKETASHALARLFDEMGAKVVTIKLTKKQLREWNKRDRELKAFLKAKEKAQKDSEKCKMVFKSGTRTGRTHVKANLVEVVKRANPIKVNGSINLKTKNGKPVKLPKNWGKVRIGKCLVQF